MIKNLIILILIVAGIYFFLKKFTVHRCPQCFSTHIRKLKERNGVPGEPTYMCLKCGATIRGKSFFKNKNL